MPIYEYECRECGRRFEIFVRSHKNTKAIECPDCHSVELQKRPSTPALMTTGRRSLGGTTCCGSTERCQTPPCTDQGSCLKDDK